MTTNEPFHLPAIYKTTEPGCRFRFDHTRAHLERAFAAHYQRWHYSTRGCEVAELIAHPDYHAIIGLGVGVVPLILRSMQRGEPGYWFPALRILTGIEPFTNEERGRAGAMTAAWLAWGVTTGHLDPEPTTGQPRPQGGQEGGPA